MAQFLVMALSLFSLLVSSALGDLYAFDLSAVESFERNASSTDPAVVQFVFYDTEFGATASCKVTWSNGVQAPSTAVARECSNQNVTFAFPTGTWKGTEKFTLHVWYSYEDDSLGPPPYNVNTVWAETNITQGPKWVCSQVGNCSAPRGAPFKLKVLGEYA